ncbi:hypothetical protein HKX48_002395 [Thoreauomyces humboldtii]|nr:hypothetical protein HKX48_002395 [Thoreauomyces humboldtii]
MTDETSTFTATSSLPSRSWWRWSPFSSGTATLASNPSAPAVPWMAAPPASTLAQPTSSQNLVASPSPLTSSITAPEGSSSTPVVLAAATKPSSTLQPVPTPETPAIPGLPAYAPKYILGLASLSAFGALMYTIRQRTRGRMAVPLAAFLESPEARAANPKLAAYMYAGRAFGTATVLVLTGTVGASMAVASVMQVNNLRDFSLRMREIMASYFPNLKRSDDVAEEKFDPDAYAFLKEVADDVEAEERDGKWRESASHQIIGNRVRNELGPLSMHGRN